MGLTGRLQLSEGAAMNVSKIILLLGVSVVAYGQVIPAQDEFVGPFNSWKNIKSGFGAVGDGSHDDTTNIQNCINSLGSGQICYFPAGTYKITSTLQVWSKTSVGLIGADPSTVTIRWGSATTGQGMIWVNGCNACQFNRLTLDGNNVASTTGFMSKFDHTHQSPNTSKNMYEDDAFINMSKGVAAGGAPPASQLGQQSGATYCANDDSSTLRRLVFTGLTTAGVSVECVNALLWTCWDCTFTNNARGMTNEFGNGGTFAAFRSVFTGSTIVDLNVANNYYFWEFEDNWSVNSNQFLKTSSNNVGDNILLRGNHVINTNQNVSIDLEHRGPFVLIDNIILTKGGNVGPVVSTSNSGAVILSVGNTFTVNNKISGGVSREIGDVVVSPSSVNATPPTPPPADPNLGRTIFEPTTPVTAATIQTAINSAVAMGNRSVVHIPSGSYSVGSTLNIPANVPIQIIGDGWGTQVNWTGASSNKLWNCAGPCLAKWDSLSMDGKNGAADLIDIQASDQAGGHVYGGFAEFDDNHLVNVLADGTVNSNIDLEYFLNGVDSPGTVGLRAIGAGGNNRIAVFGADSGNLAGQLYSVRSGGNLVVENMYYEGPILPLFNLGGTENGNFTLASFKAGTESAVCPNGGFASNASGMTGKWALVSGSTINCATYTVSGANVNQNFVGLGLGTDNITGSSAYSNSATAGTWGFASNAFHGGASIALNIGTFSDSFITTMLAQLRATHSSYLTSQVVGTTNVRMFRIRGTNGAVGIHVFPGGGASSPPTIVTSSPLPAGTVNQAYSQVLSISGSLPITCSVTVGALNTGLNLTGTGGCTISGTPSVIGTSNFTIQASNTGGNNSKAFSLTVNPAPPVITSSSPLPNGTIGVAYSQTLTATGTTPITWTCCVTGSLPTNLSISGAGVISGTPNTQGTSTFVVTATNAGGSATASLSITINVAAPNITTTSLASGTVGVAYSSTVVATGGTPITWSISQGALPSPLTIDSGTGAITGTPTTVGTYNFVVKATNGSGSGTRMLSIVIGPGAPPTITTTSPLPPATVNVAYSDTLSATGTGITWSVAPPSGLVAYYAFSEGAGPTTADLSGNGNTGTLVNATWTANGKYGNGISFNGVNALVNVADAASLHLSSAMTLEAWVNPIANPIKWQDVIMKYNDNYFLEANSPTNVPGGGGTFGGTDLACRAATGSTLPTGAGTFSHLALTYDGANVRIYVNGILSSTCPKTGAILSGSTALTIGGDPQFAQWFNGVLDEVRIYNIALSQSQIQADMNLSAGLPNWLSLNTSTGVLSGTPLSTEIDTFTINATGNSGTASRAFTLIVGGTLPVITTTSPLPSGTVNIGYSTTLVATGTGPLTWAKTSGNLPTGLMLDTIGVISGTPTVAGAYSFTVTATNAVGTSAPVTFLLNIHPAPSGGHTKSGLVTLNGKVTDQ